MQRLRALSGAPPKNGNSPAQVLPDRQLDLSIEFLTHSLLHFRLAEIIRSLAVGHLSAFFAALLEIPFVVRQSEPSAALSIIDRIVQDLNIFRAVETG